MKKICKGCKIEKDIDSFYNKKTNPDGKQSVCKICTKRMLKEYRLKKKLQVNKKEPLDTQHLNIVGATKNDYCAMYSFLSKIGYNVEGDIHTQFMNKWSLIVSNRPRKGKPNQYTYKDCKE
jgi:predicted Fe-S protein YdhL (DUF1289 family)